MEHIANTWGDGNFHFGTRQTFDITGIKYEDIPAVNAYLEDYIKEVDAAPVSYTHLDVYKRQSPPRGWTATSRRSWPTS